MSHDIYVLSAGLTALMRRQESIASNLANVSTFGYRRQTSRIDLFETALEGAAPGEKVLFPIPTTEIDLGRGKLESTGGALDFALDGEGFFAVRTPRGVEYTRNGRFTRNGVGELATATGDPVLGGGGDSPIVLGPGGEIVVTPDGRVSVDGKPIGSIGVVDFARPDLLERGQSGLLTAPIAAGERPAENVQVLQGLIEGSNVSAMDEVVDLIETQRAYERKHRAIQVINEAHETLLRAAQGI